LPLIHCSIYICLLKDYYYDDDIIPLAADDDDMGYDVVDADEEFAGPRASGGESTVKLRRHFPETWLWQSADAG